MAMAELWREGRREESAHSEAVACSRMVAGSEGKDKEEGGVKDDGEGGGEEEGHKEG